MTDSVSHILRYVYDRDQAPDFDQSSLKRSCFAAARLAGWQLGEFQWETFPLSFSYVEVFRAEFISAIIFPKASSAIALSSTLPLVDKFNTVNFSSDEKFCNYIEAHTDFIFLAPLELERDLSSADRDWITGLNPKLADALTRSHAKTIGEFMFNWWD